ncbi:MAG: hypothetical protein PF569_10315 [Candidatus Woesearchaeota archaeon]|jgi:hypothetical protein|nr:hypothetical protein [Candidatus Woesearchaeota archaeon]
MNIIQDYLDNEKYTLDQLTESLLLENKENTYDPKTPYTVRFSKGEVTFDNLNGAGHVPMNQDVNYFGYTMFMYPMDFLDLATPMSEKSEPFIDQSIGTPFLFVSYNEETGLWEVEGHEGRHRVSAIIESLGKERRIPVHCFIKRHDDWKKGNVPIETFSDTMISERGSLYKFRGTVKIKIGKDSPFIPIEYKKPENKNSDPLYDIVNSFSEARSRRNYNRPPREELETNRGKNRDMNKDTYALRRKVMEYVYRAKDLLKDKLPRINVRIIDRSEDAEKRGVLGVAGMNETVVLWIPASTLDGSEEEIHYVVFHEILHTAFGLGHDDNKKGLMGRYIQNLSNKEIDKRFLDHINNL